MKFILISVIALFSAPAFAYKVGCTTAVTTYMSQYIGVDNLVTRENIEKVCVCNSQVRLDLRNEKTGKLRKVNYRVHSVKKEFFAGMEEVYLDVTGEGYDTPGLLNFAFSKKFPESPKFLLLRGRLWSGPSFTADFEAETTSCRR